MTDATLPLDPLWPRAGGWPAPTALSDDAAIDFALVGVPAWRTSISPTNAGQTPAAIRAMLLRYSPALMPDRGVRPGARTLDDLVFADFGDVEEPDGEEGEARTRALVGKAAATSRLVVALGGDNSVTVATAQGVWGEAIRDAGLITLDAHYDLRDGVSNGSPVRRLIEAGLAGTRVVQIGIADFANSRDYAERALDYGITVVHRDELHRRPMADVMAEALEIAGAGGAAEAGGAAKLLRGAGAGGADGALGNDGAGGGAGAGGADGALGKDGTGGAAGGGGGAVASGGAATRAWAGDGVGGGPIHVDLDVDVCDRAVAPACPASVPGGISAYELRLAARLAGADPRVRSLDLAEIDATVDAPDRRTVRLAALCVLEAAVGLAAR